MYSCKKCESNEYVKAGFVKGEQRYKCKKCGCQFVPTRQKGRSKQEKLLAVWMYAHGYSFRTIAKFFKVNVHSAFVWVKSFAEKNYSKPDPIDDSVVIELDEMWHFLHSKKDKFGFGKLVAEPQSSSSIGSAEREILKPLEKCTSD